MSQHINKPKQIKGEFTKLCNRGLSFVYDIANPKCFPAEPTINVIENSDFENYNYTSYNTDLHYGQENLPIGFLNPTKVLSFESDDGTYGGQTGMSFVFEYGNGAPMANEATYSVSVYVKTNLKYSSRIPNVPGSFNQQGTSQAIQIEAYTGDNSEGDRVWGEKKYITYDGEYDGGGSGSLINPTDSNGWMRLEWPNMVQTDTNCNTDDISFRIEDLTHGKTGFDGVAPRPRLWMTAPQMERNTKCTPFVHNNGAGAPQRNHVHDLVRGVQAQLHFQKDNFQGVDGGAGADQYQTFPIRYGGKCLHWTGSGFDFGGNTGMTNAGKTRYFMSIPGSAMGIGGIEDNKISNWTMEWWVERTSANLSGGSPCDVLLSTGGSSANTNNGLFFFREGENGTPFASGSEFIEWRNQMTTPYRAYGQKIENNKPYQIILASNGEDGQIDYYLNGKWKCKLDCSASAEHQKLQVSGRTWENQQMMLVGAEYDDDDGTNLQAHQNWQGYIYKVKGYTTTLTQREIEQNYNAQCERFGLPKIPGYSVKVKVTTTGTGNPDNCHWNLSQYQLPAIGADIDLSGGTATSQYLLESQSFDSWKTYTYKEYPDELYGAQGGEQLLNTDTFFNWIGTSPSANFRVQVISNAQGTIINGTETYVNHNGISGFDHFTNVGQQNAHFRFEVNDWQPEIHITVDLGTGSP